jgi:Uma2 family endonuclease
MATASIVKLYTPEEYLELERKAAFKSEYCKGYVTAMSGAKRKHILVTGNIHAQIHAQTMDRPCEVYASDMRVRTSPTGLYTYPDVVVCCGQPLFIDDLFDTLINPTLIVEVLSPSTSDYDREGKFEYYKSIDSLREYLLAEQDMVLVEHFVRRGGEWIRTEYHDLDQKIVLESIGCTLSLRAVYAKVNLPPLDPSGE